MPDGASDFGAVLHTRFCELAGCRLPIVQTGMGWVSGARLTAATSAAGGFGILASITMSADELGRAIAKVKARTANPFGVNVRADQPDLIDRITLAGRQGVRLISFAGAPTREAVARIHDAGMVCMPTVGARRHAEKVAEFGVDALIAQGGEGGGHTGTVPTSLLLPHVVDAVGASLPVLGAGGFVDGRGLVAALAYGADGIAMGTRFLLTQESTVPDAVKRRYLDAGVFDTVVTTAVDGAPQRVIRTEVIDRLERASPVLRFPRALKAALGFRHITGTSTRYLVAEGLAMRRTQDLTWSQLAMAANAPMMTRSAMVEGNLDAGILPTGQNAGVIDDVPTVAELLDRIVAEAEVTLKRLSS
ncbi:MAG: NAD(P)H-dependent flavin oxidoreductase [Acidimicrobiales bacterium]